MSYRHTEFWRQFTTLPPTLPEPLRRRVSTLPTRNLLANAHDRGIFCAWRSRGVDTVMNMVRRRFVGRSGQSLAEYAIILAVIAMVAVLMLRGIGTTTTKSMQ